MRISLIAAVARNGCIGKDGTLPWRLSADLKHFKATTLGKPVIMGRKTWDSIGRPLPGRLNIVLTRDASFRAEGAETVSSLRQALKLAEESGAEEACIIGGEAVYREALPFADTLYLTEVDAEIDGDAWFPELDFSSFAETSRTQHPADEKNEYAVAFVTLERA
ncbi:MAG: hypothetical protein GC168_18935 [Candidatus Hydrogenedens sp.]|nr:hypothetical protein [Candidatus Hydrogenedens sp.]